MSLKHALLIALEERQGTGYEITKWFQEGPGHFWHATHQQIYRELSKLSDDGLVSFVDVPQMGKPGKKIYKITSPGRQHLIEWLLQPGNVTPLKDTLLMKIYAGHLIPKGDLMQEIGRIRKMHEDTLDSYHRIEEEIFTPQNRQTKSVQLAYLTLRNGIIMETAWLMWADEVIEQIQQTR